MERKIIHCDCDCFFAAVEMRDNPSLREIPLAIGGRADRRGVIATCNYPARDFGVCSAMSTAKALKLCPSLTVMPGNMEKYRQVSKQIMDIYRQYTELIEPLSLDEAYLDVTECQQLNGSATLIAERIRQQVVATTGITISAGVAPNKFIAKVASDWNKPNGLFVVPPKQVADFVFSLPVSKVPGVGRKTAERLTQLNVKTCGDLQRFSVSSLAQHFGRFGEQLYYRCRGEDQRAVKVDRERKSVSVEHTFAADIPQLDVCRQQIPDLFEQLKVRYKNLSKPYQINGLVVKVKFFDFTQTTIERTGLDLSLESFEQLLVEAWQRGAKPVRLLGLGYRITERKQGAAQQLALFSE